MAKEPEETALRKIGTSPDGWRGVMGERVVRDDREGRTGTGGEERPERGEETERGPAVGRGQQRGGSSRGGRGTGRRAMTGMREKDNVQRGGEREGR